MTSRRRPPPSKTPPSTSSSSARAGSHRMSATVDRPAARPPRPQTLRAPWRARTVSSCSARSAARATRRAPRSPAAPTGRWCSSDRSSTGCSRRSTASATSPRSPRRCPQRLGRRLEAEHVVRIGEKLAEQGLLAGSEDNAPPRANPLLALRWKVLFTDPKVTRAHHAAVPGAVPPVGAPPRAVGFLAVLLVRADPQGRRGRDRPGVRQAGAAAARPRAHDRVGRLPRDRPRRGVPLRRWPSGRHGRRHLPRVAGLLHGRDGRLPPAREGPPANRPRRHLLQRLRRRGHAGGLARHGRRRAPAVDRHPDAGDRQEPLAGDPRRRLPHPLRRDRGAGPLRAHGSDAEAPAPVEAARAVCAEGLGPRLRDGVGARSSSRSCSPWRSAPSCCSPSSPPRRGRAARTSSRGWPARTSSGCSPRSCACSRSRFRWPAWR